MQKGICNVALPVTLLLLLFVRPRRTKISYNLAKSQLPRLGKKFPLCDFSMDTVIGESQNMDNPT